MNSYANGEFNYSQSSFFPKKSYNKIINLNLLNSKEFVNGQLNKKEKMDIKQNDINYFIQKSMKFYSIF